MPDSCDAIVIGSGFGGAVSACRLAERGLKVVVLERGRRWRPAEFPRQSGDAWIYDPNSPQQHNGWMDVRIFRRMAVVQGAGVGGGSLVYANVSIPANPHCMDSGWPSAISYDELLPHYERVGNMLQISELPEKQLTPRHRLLREAAQAVGDGGRLVKLPLAVNFDPDWSYDLPDAFDVRHSKRFVNAHGKAQGTCVHCGNCIIGCPVGARNTLDLNYLAAAEAKGADIRPLHMVTSIAPENGRYRVHFNRIAKDATVPESLVADRVIVAAGSLNSTELLLRCRDVHATLPNLSRRLGHGWSANGCIVTPSLYSGRSPTPMRGPIISAAVDYLDGADGGHRYFIEDGGFPEAGMTALRALASRNAFARHALRVAEKVIGTVPALTRPNRIMPWLGQGVDESNGIISIKRNGRRPDGGRLKLHWDTRSSAGVVNATIARHRRYSKATAAAGIIPSTWRLFRYLITPHPLGGCNMGEDRDTGVVDHRGEVFGYPRLYVLDGSIIPHALGQNPSRTIAAIAERNIARMS
jgi:cholesterol oxidase